MKLWILRPVPKEDRKGDDPWDPWYDKTFGHVVRAETEEAARELADEDANEENRDHKAWLESKYSTCEVLNADGPSDVIISDVHSA